ncbi:MAG TPA: TetR/AcrR family transcriptional regulator [Thermoanaerobaculia bacterium]|jgi:AcrR family transcriptional regulator|nr:TetR/AcrR family transcriptional regulator [Thermoanaerobaculia bacterium]
MPKTSAKTRPAVRRRPRDRSTRSYLRASERKTHLLDVGAALVREKGWENLTIVDLARRAGVSRQLVHQYFGDLERLALELAEQFEDEVYAAAAAAIERHPSDLAAAMSETLERFLVGLREHRLAYVDLFTAHTYRRRLHSPLRAVNHRKRRRMVEIWGHYYERVYQLDSADAVGLASFQYDGLRGLVSQVDAGTIPAQEAIRLFIEVLTGAVERLAAKARRAPERARARR